MSVILLNTFCTAGMLIRNTGRTVVAKETSRWHADSSSFSCTWNRGGTRSGCPGPRRVALVTDSTVSCHDQAEAGWDRVNCLHRGSHEAVFWILDESTGVAHWCYQLLQSAACKAKNCCASHTAVPARSLGCNRKGTQPGLLTQRGVPHHHSAMLSTKS